MNALYLIWFKKNISVLKQCFLILDVCFCIWFSSVQRASFLLVRSWT